MARPVARPRPVAAATLLGAVLAVVGSGTATTVASAATVLPDPTRPPLPAAAAPAPGLPEAPGAYAVASIIVGPGRRIALVNGRQVHEGSTVGGARVVQIDRDGVVLDVGGQRRRLSVYTNLVRKSDSLRTAPPASNTEEINHE
jgi:MSHA biogenesis protein MshK